MSSSQQISNGDQVLLYQPAPIQVLHYAAFENKKLRVQMIRGDLVHPFVSGNKLWKLKFNLLEALKQRKERLTTFGGAYSNHLLAVACAAASLGLKSTGFLRGEEAMDNPILHQCRLFGMQLVPVSREEYRERRKAFAAGETGSVEVDSAYLIPEGGSNSLALEGCAEIIPEEHFDYILVAVGTGGTLAGLALGANHRSPRTRVEGIAVLKGADFLEEEIRRLAPTLTNWRMHLEFHHGGYARTTDHLMAFIAEFASMTGILLDPVYTGKMMYAVNELAGRNYFPAGAKVLVVHTGGLSGWAGFTGPKQAAHQTPR